MRFFAAILVCSAFVSAALSQSQKPKTAPPNPQSSAPTTPTKRPGEQAQWDKANAITDTVKRIAALRKFVDAFPRSTRKSEAFELISAAEAELGNAKLTEGDPQAAAEFFKAAAKDAPKPLPEKLFYETFSKFPANLYFRGMRDEAIEVAKLLEAKAETNAGQLLVLAAFYINIENGSEARRVAENAIALVAASSAAYQTLGLAYRVDFKLEDSAAAYAKALELEPDSLAARRGLAEMKRSLGKADEAVALYREILAKDEANLPARTGLILALFDAENRTEAEAELTKSLEANPGNVMLLAGAAYWYAAHNDGAQAVTFAQKAIDADPRFIWSHIALARGHLNQNKPLDAERTLLAARRYGNFPTLEYEIASARLAAGLYREAAEELAKSFSIKDGVIYANLGGRVPLESKNFSELVGFERRASIFAPMAADDPNNAAKLSALLQFHQEMALAEINGENAAMNGESFIQGDDKMKIHRQLFVASALLEKKVALPKVIEIAKNATSGVDGGLDVAEPSTAVLAGELYESRAIAATRGEYVNVPQVPRPTLTSVLRGRIEEINGWAHYQMDDATQGLVHLKRAVGILPVNSAYWRSSTWRLGNALVVGGKDAEALDAYIKSYKSTGPDAVRYKAIEAVYKRVNGTTAGLEERIGPDPSAPAPETVAKKTEPLPEIKREIPTGVPVKKESVPSPVASPEVPPPTQINAVTSPVEIKAEPTPETLATETPTPDASSTVAVTPTPATPEPSPSLTPDEIKPADGPQLPPTPSPEPTAEARKTTEEQPTAVEEKPTPRKELFPPVIITIPAPERPAVTPEDLESKPEPTSTPEIRPCSLVVSAENITLENESGDVAIIVRRERDGELGGLTAVSSSPETVRVRREKIDGLSSQALFVVHLVSDKTGDYQILFEMPCGKKEITVKVQ